MTPKTLDRTRRPFRNRAIGKANIASSMVAGKARGSLLRPSVSGKPSVSTSHPYSFDNRRRVRRAIAIGIDVEGECSEEKVQVESPTHSENTSDVSFFTPRKDRQGLDYMHEGQPLSDVANVDCYSPLGLRSFRAKEEADGGASRNGGQIHELAFGSPMLLCTSENPYGVTDAHLCNPSPGLSAPLRKLDIGKPELQ